LRNRKGKGEIIMLSAFSARNQLRPSSLDNPVEHNPRSRQPKTNHLERHAIASQVSSDYELALKLQLQEINNVTRETVLTTGEREFFINVKNELDNNSRALTSKGSHREELLSNKIQNNILPNEFPQLQESQSSSRSSSRRNSPPATFNHAPRVQFDSSSRSSTTELNLRRHIYTTTGASRFSSFMPAQPAMMSQRDPVEFGRHSSSRSSTPELNLRRPTPAASSFSSLIPAQPMIDPFEGKTEVDTRGNGDCLLNAHAIMLIDKAAKDPEFKDLIQEHFELDKPKFDSMIIHYRDTGIVYHEDQASFSASWKNKLADHIEGLFTEFESFSSSDTAATIEIKQAQKESQIHTLRHANIYELENSTDKDLLKDYLNLVREPGFHLGVETLEHVTSYLFNKVGTELPIVSHFRDTQSHEIVVQGEGDFTLSNLGGHWTAYVPNREIPNAPTNKKPEDQWRDVSNMPVEEALSPKAIAAIQDVY
jgi:hypothetical protein